MKVAKIDKGKIQRIEDHAIMFPHTSFSIEGMTKDFMEENGLLEVRDTIPFDERHQKLVAVEPYIDGDVVYTISVQELTDTEKQEVENRILSQLKSQIKYERDRRTLLCGYKVGSHWFHSDVISRTQLLGLVLAGDSIPNVQWKTMSGEFVQMTKSLAMQMFSAASQHDIRYYSIAEEAINNLTPDFDIKNIQWPESYGS